jgi:hypothetical protein
MVLKGAALALKYYKDPGLRGMRDVDIMVPAHSLARAIQIVCDMGYVAERNLATSSILRRARVSHAWQFLRAGQSCDLHWRPIVRCFAPEIPAAFWEGAEPACAAGMEFLVPCPTDQLLHVCVHGLQWDWEPSVRWVADALIVAREPIQWDRICELSEKAHIRDRLSRALRYLRARFGMLVPAVVIERLSSNVAAWEQRDADILLKPCPLGLRDSLEWHLNNFRRIRLADPKWHTSPGPIGFVQYLVTFLDADGSIHLAAKLWPEMKRRVNKQNT